MDIHWLMALTLGACVVEGTGPGDSADSGDTGGTPESGDSGRLRTCEDVVADFQEETEKIRSCTDAADCGQVLTGTSCGCTRDWVARLDADTTEFYALLAEAQVDSCEIGTGSTCDCPEADGYDCVDSTCTWAYVDSSFPYPACDADEGYGYEVDAVDLQGDEIVVGVSYSGGCASHWFTTCWPDGAFMESAPVQVNLELLHEGDELDPCDGWLSEEVRVDLLPLQIAYYAAYGGNGTIIVHIGGESVEYSF